MYTITKVTPQQLIKIIDNCKPLGLFYCIEEDGTYTAVDNTKGKPFTNNFTKHRDVYKFLNN